MYIFYQQNSSASINSNDLGANHSTASLNSNDLSSNNFATLRTSSILTRQIKEHEKKDQMYEQMSGYKIMRRQHQKALIQLEDKCRRELEDHKQKLEKEYDNLLQQFSKELEKLMNTHMIVLERKVTLLSPLCLSRQMCSCFVFSFSFSSPVEAKYYPGEEA